jgi:hypothetical protein
MTSDRVIICNDLLAYAATGLLPGPLRTKYLKTALEYLQNEQRQLTQPQRLLSKPAILDPGAALMFDRWGLYPQFGDPALSLVQYLDMRISLIESEIEAQEIKGLPLLDRDRIQSANRDIWSRHGLVAVLPFLKTCWKDGHILNLDDFFLVMHTAVRSEAFDLKWQECWEELMEADSQASNIVTRARQMAEIDARKARDPKPLETIARREHERVQELLSRARSRPFSSFLREIHGLKPVYYTLRDIWYELNFLAADRQDRSEFEYQECLVDEMQADIGQMVVTPVSGPMLADLFTFDGRSVAHCRRRLDFWEHSRIQVNHAIAQKIRERLDSYQGIVDGKALTDEVQTLLAASLSKGQHLAMTMFDTELRELKGENDGFS